MNSNNMFNINEYNKRVRSSSPDDYDDYREEYINNFSNLEKENEPKRNTDLENVVMFL